MKSQRTRLAADIGGTFTDVVLQTPVAQFTAKVPTEIAQPEQGVMRGIAVVLEQAGIAANAVDVFVHGTTLATNALIERKGANTAFITTEGFRDSLEIGYENRFDQYDLLIDKPQQLITRDRRYTVYERLNVHGEVLRELDRSGVEKLATELKGKAFEAIAIGLLHSYSNPSHEQQVRDILIAAGCQCEISLSSEVCPEVREYERFMTTVCNAYVQPLMAKYLRALQSAFEATGFTCPIFLMTSGGGMTTLENAVRFPIRLVESGPSGGAVLAARLADELSQEKVLSFDMGGTTAKIALIDHYQPKTARNFEIARAARFQKGSGMPVRIPVIEMIEIGAGGGSIAHLDKVGRLCIGPESAGAEPGPACYNKGGQRAAVTDANLVLGRIEPNRFAEGKMQLNEVAANTAIENDVAVPLGVSVAEAAFGITEMIEENMANAARIHSVEHGADLSDYTMIGFGGGGPLHGIRLAEKLGIKRVVIPADSSVGSALGFLCAPVSYEMVQSLYTTLDEFDVDKVNSMMAHISREARDIVSRGSADEELVETRSAFMRYVGQGHEIQVPIPSHAISTNDIDAIRSSYDDCYKKLYKRTIPERSIEVLSWSVVVSTRVNKPEKIPGALQGQQGAGSESTGLNATPHRQQSVYLPDSRDFSLIPAYWRPDLKPGDRVAGPALIEEPQTTCFVTAQFSGVIDQNFNLVLERVHAS